MLNNESKLLKDVLFYKKDTEKQKQILFRYALAKIFSGNENLTLREQQIFQASVILQSVPIKYQNTILERCRYAPSYREEIRNLLSPENQSSKLILLINDVLNITEYIGKPSNQNVILKTQTGHILISKLKEES